jgi:hypothetical protein
MSESKIQETTDPTGLRHVFAVFFDGLEERFKDLEDQFTTDIEEVRCRILNLENEVRVLKGQQ